MATLVTLSQGNTISLRYITKLHPRVDFLAIGRRFLTRLRRNRVFFARCRGQASDLYLKPLFRLFAVRLRLPDVFPHDPLHLQTLLVQSRLVRLQCRNLVCQPVALVLLVGIRLLGKFGKLCRRRLIGEICIRTPLLVGLLKFVLLAQLPQFLAGFPETCFGLFPFELKLPIFLHIVSEDSLLFIRIFDDIEFWLERNQSKCSKDTSQ